MSKVVLITAGLTPSTEVSVGGSLARPDFLRPLHHEDGNDNSGEAVVDHEHDDVADRRQYRGDNPSPV